MRKDRSASAGLLEFPVPSGSPDLARRNKEKYTTQTSGSRLRNVPHVTLVDLTIFHIPGMDVKLHYQSKVLTEGCTETDQDLSSEYNKSRFDDAFNLSPASSTALACGKVDSHHTEPIAIPIGDFNNTENVFNKTNNSHDKTQSYRTNSSSGSNDSSNGSSKTSLENFPLTHHHFSIPLQQQANTQKSDTSSMYKKGIKKASLFAWMTLQSVPEETIISPHILEFLEQTLEPIPTKTNFSSTGNCNGFRTQIICILHIFEILAYFSIYSCIFCKTLGTFHLFFMQCLYYA